MDFYVGAAKSWLQTKPFPLGQGNWRRGITTVFCKNSHQAVQCEFMHSLLPASTKRKKKVEPFLNLSSFLYPQVLHWTKWVHVSLWHQENIECWISDLWLQQIDHKCHVALIKPLFSKSVPVATTILSWLFKIELCYQFREVCMPKELWIRCSKSVVMDLSDCGSLLLALLAPLEFRWNVTPHSHTYFLFQNCLAPISSKKG